MTPKQADRLIKSNQEVTVTDRYGDTFTIQFTRRDRWSIYGVDIDGFSASFDRGELAVVTPSNQG